MKTIVPDYYEEFKCIAGECKHSCCIGWEIDIDNETYEIYKNNHNDILKHIDTSSSTPCFSLCDDERCPFLNNDNLCEIIINHGEGLLCQICSDHPRFRNYADTFIEIGLGLCCEAAGKLILSKNDKTCFIISNETNDTPNETETTFLTERNNVLSIIQNRDKTIDERVEDLLKKYRIELKTDNIINFLLKLERLDEKWTYCLEKLNKSEVEPDDILDNSKWDTAFEQLIVYFIFRHLTESIYDGAFKERLRFSIIGYRVIKSLCMMHYNENKELNIDIILEYSRMYSSEIEYSEENTEAVMFEL